MQPQTCRARLSADQLEERGKARWPRDKRGRSHLRVVLGIYFEKQLKAEFVFPFQKVFWGISSLATSLLSPVFPPPTPHLCGGVCAHACVFVFISAPVTQVLGAIHPPSKHGKKRLISWKDCWRNSGNGYQEVLFLKQTVLSLLCLCLWVLSFYY